MAPKLGAAIRQAESYCKKTGTLSFAVTNGHQWVVSQFFVQGVPEEQIRAIVFYDFDDILGNLQEFVDLLSPNGISNQTLATRVASNLAIIPTFAKSLNDVVTERPLPSKNYLISPMRLLMRECFGELTAPDQAEMLRTCYVSTDVTDETLKLLEIFAGDNLPPHLQVVARKLVRRPDAITDLTEGAPSGATVLLVGRAGSGKSTFLAFARQTIESRQQGHHVVLFVDLLSRTETHAKSFDHDRLISEVCRDLLIAVQTKYPELNPFARENLEIIYAGEIDRLKQTLRPEARSGPKFDEKVDALIEKHLEDPRWHLKALLGNLGRQEIPVTILLDNVDRGTPEFEMVTSKLAEHLAQNTRSTVVTCLRETTYAAGRIGFLDVRKQTVRTISPPPFAEVARRRFDIMRSRVANDNKLRKKLLAALAGTPFESVRSFAEILADLVLGGDGQLKECVVALSGTNIRRALDLLEGFSISTHTDLEQLFRMHVKQSQGRSSGGLGLDLFLRSAMRGTGSRYVEQTSTIVNLFQASLARVNSHFTRARILQLLNWRLRQSYDNKDIRVADVVSELGSIGHRADDVDRALSYMGARGLVNSTSSQEPPWDFGHAVHIGAAGHYYLTTLIYNREYQNNVADDIVVYDEATLEGMRVVQLDRALDWPMKNERKVRAVLAYLARAERVELRRVKAEWLEPIAEDLGCRRFGTIFRKEI